MEPTVRCENLVRIYRQGEVDVRALDGVSVDIPAGSFVSLCGPSGSGKTTLLNLIGGLDDPTSGEVYFQGRTLSSLSRGERSDLRLHHVGFIFQAYNLIPVLTAQENVEFVMQLQGVPAATRAQKAREMLKAVGLQGLEDRRPGALSGGQQQRVAVARAMVSTPALILADEPTANLDSTTARGLLELMRSLNETRGVTFVFSTHDPLVMEFARRVIQLKDGRIVADNTRES